MKKFNTNGIILKKINYKDSDRIYTILTPDEGKISAFARGVRKITSKRSGNLDTLNHVTLKISRTDAGYNYIDEAKVLNSFRTIKDSYESCSKAFYMSELTHKSLEEDHSVEEVFDLLLESLELMDKKKLSPDIVETYFEIHLMKILGYQLVLDTCIKCGRSINDNWLSYKFSNELGGLVCDRCSSGGMPLDKVSAAVLYNLYIKKLSGFEDKPNILSKSTSALIKHFVVSNLGDSFKSLEI